MSSKSEGMHIRSESKRGIECDSSNELDSMVRGSLQLGMSVSVVCVRVCLNRMNRKKCL